MTRLTPFVALGLLASLSAPAPAAEVYFDTVSTEKAVRTQGAYFGAFGGAATGGSVDFTGEYSALDDQSDETGFFLGLEVGYSFTTPLPIRPAVELEVLYLNNDLSAETDGTSLRADFTGVNASLNGILQLDLSNYRESVGDFWAAFRPYVGFGLGGAYTRLDNVAAESEGRKREGNEDSGFSWTYQFFGGLEVALSDGFSIYGEYKRLVFQDVSDEGISDLSRDLWGIGFKAQY